MADFLTMRDVDAFLINPTHSMAGDFHALTTPTEEAFPSFITDESYPHKDSHYAEQAAGKHAHRELNDSFVFPQDYASEEEAASPNGQDDSDFLFDGSDIESAEDFDDEDEDVESLSDHASLAQQLCSRAQTVHFVSAGKPRVVVVPRSVEVSSAEVSPIFAQENPAVIFGSSKTHQRARLGWHERLHTPPPFDADAFHFAESRPIRTPALARPDAVPTYLPTLPKQRQTPLAAQRADFSPRAESLRQQDPFPSDWPLPASPPLTPEHNGKRRVRKLPSTFNFIYFSSPRRNNSSSSSHSNSASSAYTQEDYLHYRHEPRSTPEPPLCTANFAATTYRPKMIPRGASEREPPLTLPPCPYDSPNYDWDVGYYFPPSSSPPRAFRAEQQQEEESGPSNYVKALRRKSLSAVFATAQV